MWIDDDALCDAVRPRRHRHHHETDPSDLRWTADAPSYDTTRPTGRGKIDGTCIPHDREVTHPLDCKVALQKLPRPHLARWLP